MDLKSQRTLELPKVLERVADLAAFSASKVLALALGPTADADEARRRQTETSEARKLLSLKTDLSIGGAHDVRPQVAAASRGAVLDPVDLLDIKATMIASRGLSRYFERGAAEFPVVGAIAAGLTAPPGVIEAISQTINDRGDVLDSASEALAAIRADLRVAHDRLLGKLQKMITDPKITPMLQEPIITQRDGRFVIPLRAEFKGRIKSIVHDQSASGATFFVEPLSVIDLNNQIRELELAERDEVRRILAEVSRLVGEHAAEVEQTVEALARLDLAFAKARYAERLRASEPILTDLGAQSGAHPGSRIRLLAARHPLLDPATVVPIDLVLDEDTFVLVITGPNTGGKTVTLKTAGLCALMAQCGLHIPAASGSELSVFGTIDADIGDEQSIEQSLSTFSSHITNIIRLLRRVGPHSLVVLDELGAGTDPQEGSALARSLLDVLIEKRVTTLVATHYSELKAYAYTTPGVHNASVEFDLASLRPTYHLTVGLPGRSNALSIAERLGLPLAIIEHARQLLSPEDLRAEGLLDEIHRQRDATRLAREQADQVASEARSLRDDLAARLSAIEDERRLTLEQARLEAESQVEAIRLELDGLRRALAAAAQPMQAVREIELQIEELEDRLAEPVARQMVMPPGIEERAHRLGDSVFLPALGMEGVITELGTSHAEVQIGRLRVRARLEELRGARLHGEPQGLRPPSSRDDAGARRQPALFQAPPFEIDLRGRTVDEALEELDRQLDASYFAGMPFLRIIHGKGTGRLRQAIRAALKSNPYVAGFETGSDAEGGEGVTVVKLASG